MVAALFAVPVSTFADEATTVSVRPDVGLRGHVGTAVMLRDATVVIEPGRVLQNANVVIDGAMIVDVGVDLDAPAGTEIIDASDRYVMSAMIDAYGEISVDPPSSVDGHHNGNVLPRRVAADGVAALEDIKKYRSAGVAIRSLAPSGGIVRGQSSVVLMAGDGDVPSTVLKRSVGQHLRLTVPRYGSGEKRLDAYPNSPMGAVALLRQTFLDADWYVRAMAAHNADPRLSRPERNSALQTLADSMDGTFIIDAPNERMVLRGEALAKEFSLNAWFRGSGREYRNLDAIVATGRPMLIPVDFPDAPSVASRAASDDVTTGELLHWHFAPTNPARLAESGATFCLTTDGLESPDDFLKNLRTAVERGLDADAALAAVTTTPAGLLGLDGTAGRVKPGHLANLVVFDGPWTESKSKLTQTWVAGQRFVHIERPAENTVAGSYATKIRTPGGNVAIEMTLTEKNGKWSASFEKPDAKTDPPDDDASREDDASESDKTDSKSESTSAKMKALAVARDRITGWADLSDVDAALPNGPTRFTFLVAGDPPRITDASVVFADGETAEIKLRKSPSKSKDEASTEPDEDSKDSKDSEKVDDSKASGIDIAVTYPLGAYGRTEPAPQPKSVLFRGGTVWSCEDAGVMESADVLITDGKIAAIGEKIEAPDGCVVVDAKGKHVTPGLIDCHSHMATDGGVNESGQTITAEVRIGDFIDNTDITIYRQLAGGLTMANVLHGSANPIGGQNQVIKLLWGDSMDAMKFHPAPPGIKFALGENPKRSPSRYPNSRLGVEQIIRDRLLAAKDYADAHQRYADGDRSTLPPRRDLELEAIAEIIEHRRWIHCHSYRQDEIVALLDLLDVFGIRIGTLQHILEGYKVADRMAAHGAMASSFSDWWAYKFEVYDAIPFNGALMRDRGIVVSFNSDDAELGRHMNTEAAKAVKYGGVPPDEALKFVTLNAAKQLRIDDRVGSIAVGKDGDVVLWNGPPLSTLSKCEQTWINGRLMFSIKRDQELRQRDAKWRARLIANVLDGDYEPGGGKAKVSEEDRWLRFDEFCHGHDHDHDHHNE